MWVTVRRTWGSEGPGNDWSCCQYQQNNSSTPNANLSFAILVAKRKTLFDDRPVEINELTYVIKQDLSALNSQISSLQSLSKSQQSRTARGGAEQEGEHNKNVGCLIPGLMTYRLILTRLWFCYKENLPTWGQTSKKFLKCGRKTYKPPNPGRRTSSHPFLLTLNLL